MCRPVSVQPASIKVSPTKGQENGHSPSEIDEATLRRGEAHYSTYFKQHGLVLPNTQGLAAFH